MKRRTRIAPAWPLLLVLMLPAAIAAQPAAESAAQSAPKPGPASNPEDPLPRWDVSPFFGWRGAHVADTEYGSDRWDGRLLYGATAGYYLTPNLKLEVDVAATTPSTYDLYEPRQFPGASYPLFVRIDHHVVTASVGGLVIYQFFENASFHPFVGAGAGVIAIRDRITTERQSQVISRGPNGPYDVVVTAEAETHSRSDRYGRGLLVAGFKAYPGERLFFRSDVQWTLGSSGSRDVSWRLGLGVDF